MYLNKGAKIGFFATSGLKQTLFEASCSKMDIRTFPGNPGIKIFLNQALKVSCFSKMGHSRALFLYFRLFNAVDSKHSI